jgi:hypothetical protein
MFSLYLLVKYIHILAVITAVGSNITYAVWNIRSRIEPAHMSFTLKGIKFLDDRIANPAYGVVLLSGLLMVIIGPGFAHAWIVAALILFVLLVAVAIALYSPALRDQVKLAVAGDTSSGDFLALERRARVVGIGTLVIVRLILGLMVFKPGS